MDNFTSHSYSKVFVGARWSFVLVLCWDMAQAHVVVFVPWLLLVTGGCGTSQEVTFSGPGLQLIPEKSLT